MLIRSGVWFKRTPYNLIVYELQTNIYEQTYVEQRNRFSACICVKKKTTTKQWAFTWNLGYK